MSFESIPIVDLFAGPGGLGEGFCSFTFRRSAPFNIVLSIEKDASANRTLRLRSFIRKLPNNEATEVLKQFAASTQHQKDEEGLLRDFPEALAEANMEVLADRTDTERELGSSLFPADDLDSIIRERIGGAKRWVLIGGPPCQAYSLGGRAKLRSVLKDRFEKDNRHFLYRQYLRIIGVHRPPVFVMENVKGMLSSTIGGRRIVDQIISDLEQPTGSSDLQYRLYPFVKGKSANGSRLFTEAADFIIRSEEFGIPQRRHRVIILGIRSDVGVEPDHLIKSDKQVTLRSVLADLPALRSSLSGAGDSADKWAKGVGAILDVISTGSLPSGLMSEIRSQLVCLDKTLGTGAVFVPYRAGRPSALVRSSYRQRDLGGLCNHESRRHMLSDLHRYFFAACYGLRKNAHGKTSSPKLADFPSSLLPSHENIDKESPETADFADRFRVQLWDEPATTVTSHIAKDGHYFIHPDPVQCRSLSVREAARIQTFPDDYIFLGTRTAQYHQVGNAVPPLLARQLAKIVHDVIRRMNDRD